MLVLSRKIGESFVIGNDVVVTVRETHGGRVRISIEAPQDVLVLRKELIGKRPSRQEWDAPAESPCLREARPATNWHGGRDAPAHRESRVRTLDERSSARSPVGPLDAASDGHPAAAVGPSHP